MSGSSSLNVNTMPSLMARGIAIVDIFLDCHVIKSPLLSTCQISFILLLHIFQRITKSLVRNE